MKAKLIDFNLVEVKVNEILIDELQERNVTFGEVVSALNAYADKPDCNHHFYEYVRAKISIYMTSQKI